MSARFIAIILTVATTIAAFSATPARADQNRDIKRFLGAAAGLYITGRIINELSEKNGVTLRAHDQYRPHQGHNNGNRGRGWDRGHNGPKRGQGWGRGHRKNQGWGHLRRDRSLPTQCLIRVDRKRTTFAMSRNCLRKYSVGVNRLPDRCKMNIAPRRDRGYGQHGQRRVGYAVRCLRQNGYRVGRS